MNVLRQVGQFELNEGDGMAKGLYNITNTILIENTKNEGVSYWFDTETKNNLMLLSDSEFVQKAKMRAGNNIDEFV